MARTKSGKRHHNGGLRKNCDCPRRAWSTCEHSWYLNFKPRHVDKHYRLSLDKHFGRPVTSKTEAEELAAGLRKSIREGTFGRTAPRSEMTLEQLKDAYVERFVSVEHPDTAGNFNNVLKVICRTPVPSPMGGTSPFGQWRLVDITTDTVERYRESRRKGGAGVAGTNRSLSQLRALLNWGIKGRLPRRHAFQEGRRDGGQTD